MTTRRSISTEALTRAARALRFAMVLQGVVRWGVLSAGGLLALLLLDDWLHLPQALRLPFAVVLGGFIAIEFYRKVLTLLLHPFSPARAARWLETQRGIAGNVLINAYHFDRDGAPGAGDKFVRSTIDSSGSVLSAISARSLWLTPRLSRWIAGLVVLVIVWALLAVAFPRYVFTGIERIFLPLADVPPVGSWIIDVTPSQRVQLVEGDKLDIAVRIKSALGLPTKPPVPDLVWQNSGGVESAASFGQHAAMLPGSQPGEFVFSFSAVSQPFTFSVVEDDSRSVSVYVEVQSLPQLKGAVFKITPLAYTGIKPYAQPGPPETLEVPAGSNVTARVELSPDSPHVVWKQGAAGADGALQFMPTDMTTANGGWEIARAVNDSGAYQIAITMTGLVQPRLLAQGQVTAVPDRPPEVDFITQDRNRAVTPGSSVEVRIQASDDYGVASIALQIAPSDDPASTREIKAWTYLGPPGEKSPAPETYTLQLDPGVFTPGAAYLVTAVASDFSPAHQKATSRPIILRVAGLQDMTLPQDDVLSHLFDLLKNTIALQTQANGLTNNLALHLADARQAGDVVNHLGLMEGAQTQAQNAGHAALDELGKQDAGKPYVARLQPLVHGEMGLALGQIGQLKTAKDDGLAPALAALQKRQAYILNELMALLGQIATDRQQAAGAAAKAKADAPPPAITTQEAMAKLKDDLKAFEDRQKKIIEATKTFKELNPEDLTNDQSAALGELARAEAKEAEYFQQKLTDLSKIPLQDFGDGKVVGDMNEVYQEVQKAAESAYQKRAEMAVAGETAGLEKAAQIEQNLERWLPNTPDNTKWSMEEPQGQNDIPLAELPKQLDDLVGDLLKKENEMDPDKDDVSSSIMDSVDKGAGWGTGDGPESNMSAKGVTGNQQPNNTELTGRAGEGRSGKSDGQMVGDIAIGKGGKQTPTRMVSTPYENGAVNDTSKDPLGGATGGGKLSGAGEDGLRGTLPPVSQQRLRILADQQSKLRQQAESLALQLRKQRRPTGDLESAIAGMKQYEAAAQKQDGLGVVQGYHQALDALSAARANYAGQRLSRLEANALIREAKKDTVDTQAEDAPAGYEEMTGAYFRSLSEAPPAEATNPPPAK